MSKKNEKSGEFAESEQAEPIHEPDFIEAKKPSVAAMTFERWAEAKGHIKRLPPPGKPRGAYVLPGPDFRVVKAHTRWPSNQVVSEAEYDAAVKDTYGQELRER
ncbi:MAG: hypothetical protein ACRCU1_03430 [Alsobacter sp.]